MNGSLNGEFRKGWSFRKNGTTVVLVGSLLWEHSCAELQCSVGKELSPIRDGFYRVDKDADGKVSAGTKLSRVCV